MLNTNKHAGLTDQLATFTCVANLLSFTKAGDELSMTQPAVTFQITQLEDAWGCKLFLREHNAVQLTEAGEVMLIHARRLATLCEDFTTMFTPMYANKKIPTYSFSDLKPNARAHAIQQQRKNMSDEFIAELMDTSADRGNNQYYASGLYASCKKSPAGE